MLMSLETMLLAMGLRLFMAASKDWAASSGRPRPAFTSPPLSASVISVSTNTNPPDSSGNLTRSFMILRLPPLQFIIFPEVVNLGVFHWEIIKGNSEKGGGKKAMLL